MNKTDINKEQIKEQARSIMIRRAREATEWTKVGVTYEMLDGCAWTSWVTWTQTRETCFEHLTWQEIEAIAHSVFDGKSIKDFASAAN